MKTTSVLILIQLISFFTVNAQNAMVSPDSIIEKPLTIVYDIQVKRDSKKAGIEETYNGGIKTLFIQGENARIRLVSLMRIQSIFFFKPDQKNNTVSIIKESGDKKYRYDLNDSLWNLYNVKYKNDSCIFSNDSLEILHYNCKKATILLQDGKKIIAYYTSMLKPLSKKIEPAFSGVPGVVLQYEYDYGKGSITYIASKVSNDPIASDIFIRPSKNIRLQKFTPSSD